MEYIRITRDNIDAEHVCCAMSGKQALAKKEWLKRRFDEGLIFYRSVERGKCFIEYIPAENAWVPIQADGYLYIDCLWAVSYTHLDVYKRQPHGSSLAWHVQVSKTRQIRAASLPCDSSETSNRP